MLFPFLFLMLSLFVILLIQIVAYSRDKYFPRMLFIGFLIFFLALGLEIIITHHY